MVNNKKKLLKKEKLQELNQKELIFCCEARNLLNTVYDFNEPLKQEEKEEIISSLKGWLDISFPINIHPYVIAHILWLKSKIPKK